VGRADPIHIEPAQSKRLLGPEELCPQQPALPRLSTRQMVAVEQLLDVDRHLTRLVSSCELPLPSTLYLSHQELQEMAKGDPAVSVEMGQWPHSFLASLQLNRTDAVSQ